MTDGGFGDGAKRLGEIKRYTDIRWRDGGGTEIGVVDARVMVKERSRGREREEARRRIRRSCRKRWGLLVFVEGKSGGRSGRIPAAMRRGAIGSWDAERHTGWPP